LNVKSSTLQVEEKEKEEKKKVEEKGKRKSKSGDPSVIFERLKYKIKKIKKKNV
jgi:hypothetical protein